MLIARASVVIASSPAATWDALLRPETIMKMLPLREVILPWRSGQPFHWIFDMLGKPVDVRGDVFRVDGDARVLEYDYVDPLSAMRGVEHRHRVSITVAADASGARVDVVQDANLTDVVKRHAEGGWRLALHHLKHAVETGA